VALRGKGTRVEVSAVDVWRIGLAVRPATVRTLERLLDADERERLHRRSDPVLRRRYAVAHGAARCIVARYTAVPAEDVRWRRGRYGKPELCGDRPVRVSLTHAGDLALLAVIAAARDVGVDVELPRRTETTVRLAERYFPAAEAELVRTGGAPEFARLWTRKEACVKAMGGKLAHGLMLAVAAGDPPHLAVRDLPLPAHWAGAVALCGEEPFAATVRDWTGMEHTEGCHV
jgi:4'-phosphopantetheinyl transferase